MRHHRPSWLWILTLFATTRATTHLAGVHFDDSNLPWTWQFIDPALLRTHLAESLLYLHSQPPLFNLYLGTVLKLAGTGAAATFLFASTFRLLTLAAWLAGYHLLTAVGLPRWGAVVATSLYFTGSTALLYESWLFYTWPTAALLVLAAAALTAYLAKPGAGRGALFFALLATICLTRSSFHLAWFVAVAGLLLVARPRLRRLTLRAALIPLLLVVGLYAKNLALFGTFSASSWMWMSLYKMNYYTLLDPANQPLLDDGTLSPLAPVKAWAGPREYADVLGPSPATGVPVLDDYTKSTGEPNMNHLIFLEALPLRRHDTLALARARPGNLAGVVAASTFHFARPPSDYFAIHPRAARLDPWRRAWEAVAYGTLSAPSAGDRPARTDRGSPLLVVALAITLAAGLVLAWRRRGRWTDSDVVFLFISGTLGYATAISVFLEVVENHRFRVMLEPLLALAVAMLVARAAAAWRQRREAARESAA